MKPRRVVVTVELKSATPIEDLKKMVMDRLYNANADTQVQQVQANVIKMDAKTRKTYCRGEH